LAFDFVEALALCEGAKSNVPIERFDEFKNFYMRAKSDRNRLRFEFTNL
jgi:hypothetical protein